MSWPLGEKRGFQSGILHVTNLLSGANQNSVITGHNSFGGNKQLWYLGSTSGSNDNIAFINRQNGSLGLWTNNTPRLNIEAGGIVKILGTLEIGTVQTYTASNVTTDRAFNADAIAIAELADVVGTLIADLRTMGMVN